MSDDIPEFARIARHFAPLAGDGAFGLTDDAACLPPAPPGRDLVLTVDAMVAGVHFLPADPPDLVARKLLRVNLSDLAAKAAMPVGYLLTLSVPRDQPETWFAGFAAGLAADQAAFGLALLGGDTTSTPGPVTVSATMIGTVAAGGMVRRAGARAGDAVYVTGTIGDGALGLLVAQGRLQDASGALLDRYRLPVPRLGVADAGCVTAGMDVSDGLVQDLGHLCRASGLGAVIEAEAVPASAAARALPGNWLRLRLTGGDDYELLLAVAPEQAGALERRARAAGVAATRIGTFVAGARAVTVRLAGRPLDLGPGGWSHF